MKAAKSSFSLRTNIMSKLWTVRRNFCFSCIDLQNEWLVYILRVISSTYLLTYKNTLLRCDEFMSICRQNAKSSKNHFEKYLKICLINCWTAKKFAVREYTAENYDDQFSRNDNMQRRIQRKWGSSPPAWNSLFLKLNESRKFKL